MKKLLPRILAVQMPVILGDLEKNSLYIKSAIQKAKREGYDVVVLPELATTGYLLGDRFEDESFLNEIEITDEDICKSTDGILAIWGSVKVISDIVAEDNLVVRANVARIAKDGKWVSNGFFNGYMPKTNLPKYGIFDDARQFTSSIVIAAKKHYHINTLLRPFEIETANGIFRFGLTICEDIWEDAYEIKPTVIYGEAMVDFIINISCSPWMVNKGKEREKMLKKRIRTSKCPILYVNAVGLQNNTKNLVWFDGGSLAINKEGKMIWRAAQHEAEVAEVNLWSNELAPKKKVSKTKQIHDAIIYAMRDFYRPFKKVVIGLSGGIDSAVSMALVAKAIGPEKIIAVNMPTNFNSKTTKDLAAECAKSVGVQDYRIVNIQSLYESHIEMLKAAGYTSFDTPQMKLTLENVQARIRGASVLAAIAQAEEGVFICNGNKTEVALNYFTLYGDGAGASAFLADLWKGQIYDLARYINEVEGRDFIPQGIIDLIPSAELSVEQNVDEGKGDPIFYPYHDKLLEAFTEKRWGIAKIMLYANKSITFLEEKLGCSKGIILPYFKTAEEFVGNLEWAWNRYNLEFKRGQLPPGFKTSKKAFGFDRRDPIASNKVGSTYLKLKKSFLEKNK